jgi:hypothetical protein
MAAAGTSAAPRERRPPEGFTRGAERVSGARGAKNPGGWDGIFAFCARLARRDMQNLAGKRRCTLPDFPDLFTWKNGPIFLLKILRFVE